MEDNTRLASGKCRWTRESARHRQATTLFGLRGIISAHQRHLSSSQLPLHFILRPSLTREQCALFLSALCKCPLCVCDALLRIVSLPSRLHGPPSACA